MPPAARTRPGRSRRTLTATEPEARCATALLAATPDQARFPHGQIPDGLGGLLDRGLVTLTPEPGPAHLTPDASGETWTRAAWVGPDAAATGLRLVVARYGLGAWVQTLTSRCVGASLAPAAPVPLSTVTAVLAWHYRYTPVRAVTLTPPTATHPPLLTEHAPGSAAPSRTWAPPRTSDRAAGLSRGYGTAVTSDDGERLADPDLGWLVAQALAACPDGVSIDLDRLHADPRPAPGTTPRSDLDGSNPGLPGSALDAAAYLGAPGFTAVTEFVDWAETGLLLAVRCGTNQHRVRLDPHTHRLVPHPATAATAHRHDAEHLLTALTGPPVRRQRTAPRAALTCAQAQTWVEAFGPAEQYARDPGGILADQITAARLIARTVQCLDAGVPLALAAPFAELGMTADQIRSLLAQQRRDPDRVRRLLLTWARWHYDHDTTPVADLTW